MAAFKNKGTPKALQGSGSGLRPEEDGSNKPLSTAIMQELQNFKEKFKNDEEDGVKGMIFVIRLFNFLWVYRNPIPAFGQSYGSSRMQSVS